MFRYHGQVYCTQKCTVSGNAPPLPPSLPPDKLICFVWDWFLGAQTLAAIIYMNCKAGDKRSARDDKVSPKIC